MQSGTGYAGCIVPVTMSGLLLERYDHTLSERSTVKLGKASSVRGNTTSSWIVRFVASFGKREDAKSKDFSKFADYLAAVGVL